jgi:hypothetical protein
VQLDADAGVVRGDAEGAGVEHRREHQPEARADDQQDCRR